MYTEPDKFKKMRQEYGGIGSDALQLKRHQEKLALAREAKDTTIEGFNALMKFMDGKTTKTEVINQLESISTPDVDKVVQALSKLDADVLANKIDFKPLTDALKTTNRELSLIPKSHAKPVEQREDVKVTNLSEIKLDNSDVVTAIKGLKLDVKAPIINTEKTDIEPLRKIMLDLLTAINKQKPVVIPEYPTIPETDLTKVEKKLDESNKHLKTISEKKFGGGGGGGGNGTPYVDATGKPVNVVVGFDPGADITTDLSTDGIIIETDGVKTLTTTITSTSVTEIWS